MLVIRLFSEHKTLFMDIRNQIPQNQKTPAVPSQGAFSGGDAGPEGLQQGPQRPEEKKESKGTSFFVELVKIILLAFLIIIPIRTFIFQPFFVQGNSMEPSFSDGEYLIINELGYKKTVVAAGEKEFFSVEPFKDLNRGDPVVFRYPRNPRQFFIKRIVGLPGERIVIRGGNVRIYNDEHPEGFVLEEKSYLPNHIETKGDKEFQLGENDYIVLGDNRSHSSDSRTWGALPGEFIIGKVLLRAWPVDQFEIF